MVNYRHRMMQMLKQMGQPVPESKTNFWRKSAQTIRSFKEIPKKRWKKTVRCASLQVIFDQATLLAESGPSLERPSRLSKTMSMRC